MRKLPSLNLLITFEAAARHLSFKLAAEELFVSPSAVSHQVRTLEKALDTTLFVRLNRSLELTKEGDQYFHEIEHAIRKIHLATEKLIAKDSDQSLLIHSIPFLTDAYIAPNLKSFKTQFPDLKITIESKIERAELMAPQRSHIEVAIRHGKDKNDKLCYDEITPVKISPVCAPNYSYQDKATQLQLSIDRNSWVLWQSEWQSKLKDKLEFDESLDCDGMHAVVNMAEQGLGIAMGYFPFLNPKIKQGDLSLVFPDQMTEVEPLYLVYSKEDSDKPMIAALRSWLSQIIG